MFEQKSPYWSRRLQAWVGLEQTRPAHSAGSLIWQLLQLVETASLLVSVLQECVFTLHGFFVVSR